MGLPGLTRVQADQRYAALRGLRRRDLPGYAALPTLMATPPTISQGTAAAATAIAGSILTAPSDTSAFTYYGTIPGFGGAASPGSGWYQSNAAAGGVYPGGTTPSPWAVEFDLDASDPRFEVKFYGKGTGSGIRVLINGQYATQASTFVSATADNAAYLGLVTLAAAGIYRIRLEFEATTAFGGIQTSPLNAVNAAPKRRSQRWMFFGDSFTEPTISDTGGSHKWDGYVQLLAYLLGVDAWAAGSGGTGYLKTNGARGNFLDRITDLTRNNPDVVLFAGGINDFSSFTAAAIGAQALAVFQATKAALPQAQIIVMSPYTGRGFQSYSANFLATADAIKAAAATAGVTFIDVLRLPAPRTGTGGGSTPTPATTLAADVGSGNTQITTVGDIPLNTYIQIGTGANAQVRRVTGKSGTGPYTLQFSGSVPSGGGGTLAASHLAGEAVIPVGQGLSTGSGQQGATTGDGTSDRYTGNDGTHPTVAGHRNLARGIFRELTVPLLA